MSTPERNAPCPCGSGKKYKQCCINQARPKPLVPLKMRQIVVTSQQKTPLADVVSTADPHKPVESVQSIDQSAPASPTQPTYDSLMERVFGSACATNKTHLQAKEKGTSATLESVAEKDLTE